MSHHEASVTAAYDALSWSLARFPTVWKAADLELGELGRSQRGVPLFLLGVELARVIPMLIMFERLFRNYVTFCLPSDIVWSSGLGA
jgi:hypothetical protein